MKFTPGPWRIHFFTTRDLAQEIFSEEGCVAHALLNGRSHEERNANAQLIAAAPELLEALSVLLRNNELGEYESQRLGLPRMIEAQEIARIAIAKALGE